MRYLINFIPIIPIVNSILKPSITPTSYPFVQVDATLKPSITPTSNPSKSLTLNPSDTPSFALSLTPTSTKPCHESYTRKINDLKLSRSINEDPNIFFSAQSNALNWLINEDKYYCYNDKAYDLVQRYSLAVFYYSTNGDDWRMCGKNSKLTCKPEYFKISSDTENANINWEISEDWLSQAHECYWAGVKCKTSLIKNPVLNIDRVDLKSMYISGTIPSEIEAFKHMRYFIATGDPNSIKDNHSKEIKTLRNTIPTQIGSLSELEFLYLDNNSLTGKIPNELYFLTKLYDLNLGSNKLSGSIHTDIGTLTKLINFDVSNNNLSSSIPSQMGKLTSLTEAYFYDNNFNGSVPAEICKLKKDESFGMLKLLSGRDNLKDENCNPKAKHEKMRRLTDKVCPSSQTGSGKSPKSLRLQSLINDCNQVCCCCSECSQNCNKR